jgi:hypothetical protein
MGLYDFVSCEMPLDGNPGDLSWNTKYFEEPGMWLYTIRADGTLWEHRYRWEEPPAPKHKESLEDLRERLNKRKRIDLPPEQIEDIHGDMHFYSTDKDNVWWEYRARFTEGRVSSLKRLSPPGPDP